MIACAIFLIIFLFKKGGGGLNDTTVPPTPYPVINCLRMDVMQTAASEKKDLLTSILLNVKSFVELNKTGKQVHNQSHSGHM